LATRVGIELSPAACRIIEIEGGPPWVRSTPGTRVVSFEVLTPSELDSHASLRALRKRPVSVVVWGVPNDHRQVVVTNKSYDAMRCEALTALASAGIETRGVLADVAPTTSVDRSARRPVVVALAASVPSSDALAPLHNAGVRVRSLLTPAAALASLARTRRTLAVRDSIEAYIAIDQIATCITLMRNGALITARELSWGYLEDVHRGEPRPREEIADHIAGELAEFVSAIGASPDALGQVCVCGGVPELRTMTARLTEKLDIEVEPLDSMYGLSPDLLDEREDEFRERSAEMRLAWAAAAVWPPVLDLLHARRRRSTKTALSRAAIVAGAALGLGIGWQIQQSTWLRTNASQATTRPASNGRPASPPAPARAATVQPASASSQAAPTPAPVASAASTPAPPAVATTGPAPPSPTPPAVTNTRPAPSSPAPSGNANTRSAPLSPAPPQAAATNRPASPPAAIAQPSSNARQEREPERAPTPRLRTEPKPAPPAPVTRAETPTVEPAPRQQPPPRVAPAETAIGFDASLGTILYSPDRKLAIVDGRIVGVGDEVRGARVTEITPNAVILRDAQGRLRRLALSGTR
jgi:hypothetical protein